MSGPNTATKQGFPVQGFGAELRVSFKGKLDAGVLLVSSPTVIEVDSDGVEVSPSDLTIANVVINTETLTIENDTSVLAGQAIVCTFTGHLAATGNYRLLLSATNNSGNPLPVPGFYEFTAVNS